MAKDSVMKGWQIQRFGDPVKAAAILNQLRPLFDNGSLNRPRIAERYSLDAFVTAYNRVRTAAGKVVFETQTRKP
jgi:hypothetical protein